MLGYDNYAQEILILKHAGMENFEAPVDTSCILLVCVVVCVVEAICKTFISHVFIYFCHLQFQQNTAYCSYCTVFRVMVIHLVVI